MKKPYSQLLDEVKPFVNIKIKKGRKNFTTAEKAKITRYYNILQRQGYFDSEREGFEFVSIAGKKAPKIKGAPLIKKRPFYVGTVVENGYIKTDPKAKAVVKNGKIYRVVDGKTRSWRFEYNIAKNWKQKDFVNHLIKQIGKKNLKKTQFFMIGAGIKYEVRGNYLDSLNEVAKNILKIAYAYTPNLKEKYEDRGQEKNLSDWMQEIVVYESQEDIEKIIKNKTAKKKRKKRKK